MAPNAVADGVRPGFNDKTEQKYNQDNVSYPDDSVVITMIMICQASVDRSSTLAKGDGGFRRHFSKKGFFRKFSRFAHTNVVCFGPGPPEKPVNCGYMSSLV